MNGTSTCAGRLLWQGDTRADFEFPAADFGQRNRAVGVCAHEVFGNSKRCVQGRLIHADQKYALWVTDPVYERRFLKMLDGSYSCGKCYLTVSLGEPFKGNISKLIAAVIGFDGQ